MEQGIELSRDQIENINGKKHFKDSLDKYSVVKTYKCTPTSNEVYIYQITIDGLNGNTFATSLSDCTLELLDIESMTKVLSFKGHMKPISDIRFSHDCDKQLWSCSVDGSIKVWDTRQKVNKPSQQFQDTSNGVAKPLLNFDLNKSNSIVCAGSELIREDAFLLFWDIKASKMLGGYWESHMDDITQVYFHPNEMNTVLTGSTDGLINIFNIDESSEDDALQTTCNTNSSVYKLKWHDKKENEVSFISCLTHTDDFQLWKPDEGILNLNHSKERLKEMSHIEYLIECFQMTPNDEALVLAGTEKNDGRLLDVNSKGITICASLDNGHTGVIRSAIKFDQGIITGGEDGLVCVWQKNNESFSKMPPFKKLRTNKEFY